MQYRLRKPELIPSLFIGGLVILMFTLGIWQLQRLQWKNQLLAQIEEAQSHAPRTLTSFASLMSSASDAQATEWHNVVAEGTFRYDKELYATPRYYQEKLGYAILTPLEFKTERGVQYVLVNRGWVPPEQKSPELRKEGNVSGKVTVEGVIRIARAKGLYRPDNQPEKNLWFWYDVPAMAKQTDLPLWPIYIDASQIKTADGKAVSQGPIPFPIEISIRNDHLGYAITWFLMGLTGIVMFVIYYLEKKPDASA